MSDALLADATTSPDLGVHHAAGASERRDPLEIARDLVTLTKPRITFVVLITAAGGMKLAPGSVSATTWACTMIGTALVVGAANALNMYLERDVDAKMERTRGRPLPMGHLAPAIALWFGVGLAVASLPLLAFGVNATTGLLGALALVSYVLLYTPLKRYSVWALWVGAVPGAIPPLLGWSAITGAIDVGGVSLFAIMFIWQIPHFLAISIFRADDYARAGLKVVPVEKGDAATNRMIVGYSVALVAASVWPYVAGVGGVVYLALALVLGAVFMGIAVRAYRLQGSGAARAEWARSLFAYSILYIVLLFGTLVATGGA